MNRVKELAKLSFPALLSSMPGFLAKFAVVPILGRYSIEAMVAGSCAFAIFTLFDGALYASFTGYRILGSKSAGTKNFQEAFTAGITFAMLISIIMMFLIFLFNNELIAFFGLNSNSGDTFELCKFYMDMYLISYPLSAFCIIGNITLLLNKKIKILSIMSICDGVFGFVIRVILVHKLVGAKGAGYAALIHNLLFALLYFFIIKKYVNGIVFKLHKNLKRISVLSIPSMFAMICDHFGNSLIFSIIGNLLGQEAFVASRIIFSITIISFIIVMYISSGFNVLGGAELGKNNYKSFYSYYIANGRLLFISACILCCIILIFRSHILVAFTLFKEIRALAYTPVAIASLYVIFMAMYQNNSMYLKLVEKVKADMVCNILSIWLIQIPISYYMGITLGMGLVGFAIGSVLYAAFRFLATYIIVRHHVMRHAIK
ncbi:MATE family efflux transporter [Candidatus Cyrtobacter comes]|uniref:MATE family efflux transporter n=1 Tax=Candidatus Cyrtobacter comes TaxID=675776 RepID=A0ABU5L8X9_9RICK|nr:MATE family efflux transporter [Candidatus Cyrtobacter comes]MDZ5762576.1 MATE family efflux transporter [Candidatus Cyrtobacter comes]